MNTLLSNWNIEGLKSQVLDRTSRRMKRILEYRQVVYGICRRNLGENQINNIRRIV